jgi:hypothetical protein
MCDPLRSLSKNEEEAIPGLAMARCMRRYALFAIVALWFVVVAGEALIAAALVITWIIMIAREPVDGQAGTLSAQS